jgi:hypothetical protein
MLEGGPDGHAVVTASARDSRENLGAEVCRAEAVIEDQKARVILAVFLEGRLALQQRVEPVRLELGQDMILTDDCP